MTEVIEIMGESTRAEPPGLVTSRIDGLGRVMRAAGAIDFGTVAANTPKCTGAPVPFGGTKRSGLGREGFGHGIDDYSELKYLCLGGLA
jgi:acyl-CoA reductase-like NAD-dependent aldehyde dehydrogenase